MREEDVEEKLITAGKKHDGICLKWASPGYDGAPDRIVLMSGETIGFVEAKASEKHPRLL